MTTLEDIITGLKLDEVSHTIVMEAMGKHAILTPEKFFALTFEDFFMKYGFSAMLSMTLSYYIEKTKWNVNKEPLKIIMRECLYCRNYYKSTTLVNGLCKRDRGACNLNHQCHHKGLSCRVDDNGKPAREYEL